MATAPELVVTLTADTTTLRAAIDVAARAVETLTARIIARRIVLEVLEERARAGGPVGRAALAELDHRDPRVAYRIRHEEWQLCVRMLADLRLAIRTPAEFRVIDSPA